MSLFEKFDSEEFLVFLRNFNMTLAASRTLEMGSRIEYLIALVHFESLHQFDSFSAEMESTETLNMEYIIKGLASYFYL